jgi:dipeptidyl aminopeptidase/acylaminoacyl peptidase
VTVTRPDGSKLWGLVKTPELYRCGISFAGVVDLDLSFRDRSDIASDRTGAELMRHRIGDPRLNKQQFDQVSPLKQAGRIVAPVLLMHGEDDRRVPLVHGETMRDALRQSGKQVEWMSFAREGHGISSRSNLHAYFNAITAFLEKHIGPGEVQRPPPVPAAMPAGAK